MANEIKGLVNITTGTAIENADAYFVLQTSTINGYSLSASVSLSASDVGLGNVSNVDYSNPENIKFPASINAPTLDSLKDFYNNIWSATSVSGFELFENSDGTISLSGGQVVLRSGTANNSPLQTYFIADTPNIVLQDNVASKVYADYNSGSPILTAVITTTSLNSKTKLALWMVSRVGNEVYSLDIRNQGVNFISKSVVKDFMIGQIQHAFGATLAEVGTRELTIDSGIWYVANSQIITPAFDTTVSGTFTSYFNSPTGWFRTPGETTVDNTSYNPDMSGLIPLSAGYFGCKYVYLIIDNDPSSPDTELAVVYGSENQVAAPSNTSITSPTTLPPELSVGSTAVLVGRITVQEGQAAFTEITTPYVALAGSITPTQHNTLAGLQGGGGTEYWHLTNSEHTVTIQPATAGQDGYLDSADWSTFNGKQDALGFTAVPDTRTVNGHPLSADVTVTSGDVGLGLVENVAISTWAGSSNITSVGTIANGTWNADAIAWNKVNKDYSSLADLSARYFTSLSDAPSSYIGEASKVLRVNTGETGIEFVTVSVADEKVKGSAGDPTAGYLDSKIDPATFYISGGILLALSAVQWNVVNKTGSSLADLTTRSAGDLSSGNLQIARLPISGHWSLSGNLDIDNTLYINEANEFVGINTAPIDLLHVYGTDSSTSGENSVQRNSIVLDGVVGGDKNFILADGGASKWANQIYRNEGGEFYYIYNYPTGKEPFMMSEGGRVGINKQSNIMNYHNYYLGGTSGMLNDMDTGGTYTKTYQQLYEFAIVEYIASGTNKFFVAGNNWTGGNWATTSNTFLHTAGATTDATLLNTYLEASSILNGNSYKIVFTVTGRSAGSVTPKLGTAAGSAASTNGTFSEIVTANANNADLIFTPDSAFDGAISNISVVRVISGHDTFRWRRSTNGTTFGVFTSAIEITAGVAQNIENGVTVTFGADVGHNGSDAWRKYAYAQLPSGTFTVAPRMLTEIINTPNYTIGSPVWTDYTFNFSSRIVGGTTCLSTGTNGALYVGDTMQYNSIYIDINTAAAGCTLVVEYWNGAAWVAVVDFVDNTANLTTRGSLRWDKSLMTDWTLRYPEGKIEAGSELFWLRLRSSTSMSSAPIVNIITPQGDTRMAVHAAHLDAFPALRVDTLGRTVIGGDGKATGSNIFQIIGKYNTAPTIADATSTVEIDSENSNANSMLLRNSFDTTTAGSYSIANSRGSLTSPTNLQALDALGQFKFKGFYNSTWDDMAYLKGTYRGNGLSQVGDISMFTSLSGAPVETMRFSRAANGYGDLQIYNDATTLSGVGISTTVRLPNVGVPATPAANISEMYLNSNRPYLINSTPEKFVMMPYNNAYRCRCSGNVSVTSTGGTFSDITNMSFQLLANTEYYFYFYVIYQSTNTNTGIALSVNGPASPNTIIYHTHIPTTATAITHGSAIAYNAGTPTASTLTANADYFAHLHGIIRNGANAGTFILRASSETGTAVSVRIGSYGILHEYY